MKKIAFILAAVLNITINNTIAQDQFHTTVSGSYDGAMRDLLAQARPDRGAPLTYERRGNQVNFYEYYVSGEDNACGFRALGFASREDGIQAIRERLNNSQHRQHHQIHNFIQKSIRHEDDDVFSRIFGFNKNQVTIDAVSQNIETLKDYLNYYAQAGRELLIIPNRDYASGNLFDESDMYCSLMNALAYIQQSNLCVYTQDPENLRQLRLSHSFMRTDAQRQIDILHKNGHFNRLVLVTDERQRAEARYNEARWLGALERREGENLRQTRAFFNAHSIGLINDQPQQARNEAFVISSEPEYPAELGAESGVDIATITTTSVSYPIETTETPVVGRISLENLNPFMNRRLHQLPGMNRAQSLNAVYEHLKSEITAHHIEIKTLAIYGIIRLFLEHDYVPQEYNSDNFDNNAYIQYLLDRIPAVATPKLVHYGKIYYGRLLVKLRQHADAYHAFMSIGHNYTQTFRVDLAALLLEENYVPEGFNRSQAREQGLDILNDILNPEIRVSSSRLGRSRPQQRPHAQQAGQPLYLNSRETRHQVADMLHRHGTSSSETEYDSSEEISSRPDLLTDAPDAPRPRFRRRTETAAASGATIRLQTPAAEDATSSNDDTSDDASDALPENDRSFTDSPEYEESAQDQEERRRDEAETYIRAQILRAYTISNQPEAIQIFKECLEQSTNIGSRQLQIEALMGLGNAGDGYDHGATHYKNALAIALEIGGRRLQCQALIGLGNARDGEDNGATHYREALAIARTLGDRALVQKAEKGINNCTRAQQRRGSQNQNRPQGYRPAATSTSSQRITGNKRPYDQEYRRGDYRDDDHDKRRRRM